MRQPAGDLTVPCKSIQIQEQKKLRQPAGDLTVPVNGDAVDVPVAADEELAEGHGYTWEWECIGLNPNPIGL